MKIKFDDKELDKIMKEIVIISDTREKKMKGQDYTHIQKYFEDKKIKYIEQVINYGDYSAMIPSGVIKGIDRNLYFTDEIVIERKKDIDELCGNLKDKASRLKSEFAHLNKNNTKYFIFLEDTLYIKHLHEEKYRSMYKTNSLRARLKSICAEYKTQIVPIPRDYMAIEIYETLKYEVRNILKRELKIIE